jgi:hypothetical protein
LAEQYNVGVIMAYDKGLSFTFKRLPIVLPWCKTDTEALLGKKVQMVLDANRKFISQNGPLFAIDLFTNGAANFQFGEPREIESKKDFTELLSLLYHSGMRLN